MMRAAPRPGTPSYRQGFAPTIEFADRAKVLRTGLRDCVPLRCFTHVLLTDETNPNEPGDGHQRKFYAPGIGPIRAAPVGGREREVLVLTRVDRLGPDELATVRRRALRIDKRAYTVSRRVYGRTPPAGPAPPRRRPGPRRDAGSAHRPDLADQAAVALAEPGLVLRPHDGLDRRDLLMLAALSRTAIAISSCWSLASAAWS